MAKRVALSDRTTRRIGLKESAARFVPAIDLAERLGAEEVGPGAPRRSSPLTFAATRQEVFERLRSIGGGPGLEGTERKKIPVRSQDWQIAEKVADRISEPGFRPSAGQVASILLSMSLQDVNASMEATVKRKLKPTE